MDQITYHVHRVINGPFQCPKGDWWLTCSVEDVEAKEMFEDDIPFINFDAAYKFQSYFLSTIDPIVINIPYEGNDYV